MDANTLHNLFVNILTHVDAATVVYVFLGVLFLIFLVLFLFNRSKNNIYSKYEKVYQVSNIISTNELSTFAKKSILVELDTIVSDITNKPTTIYTELLINYGNKEYDVVHHNQHVKFLTAYRNQRWDMAIIIANSLKTSYQGDLKKYYTTMINRCQYYKKHPPGNDWPGIWNRTTK